MSASPSEPAGGRRLPAGRKAELAAYVAARGEVTVAALAEQFDVSADTIRRDLDQLDADGALVRTHGGAVSPGAMPPAGTGLDVRLRLRVDQKDAIGRIAAGLVEDNSSLMVNAGTTTLAVARHLRDHRRLTIATNSLRFAAEMPEKAYRDLYMFGGAVRATDQATIGPVRMAVPTAANELDIRCDLAIIGVGAVDVDGFFTSNLNEAAMMREMMSRAARVAVLADSTKFGRRLFAQVTDLNRVDYLITEAPPTGALASALERSGVHVLHTVGAPPRPVPRPDAEGVDEA